MSAVRRDTLRELWAHVPASVAIVSAIREGHAYGTTATAVMPLSLDPPLVLISLLRDSRLLHAVRTAKALAVSYLSADDVPLASALSRKSKECETVEWTEIAGVPAVTGARLVIVGTTRQILEFGDHSVVICDVEHAAVVDPLADPMVYARRRYGSLS